jgi:choline dehydrogenase-like flavoprotein
LADQGGIRTRKVLRARALVRLHGSEFQPEVNYYVGVTQNGQSISVLTRRTTSRASSDYGHKLDGMLSQLGMHEHHLLDRSLYLHKSMPIGATAHQADMVRFGTDPAASALDVNCKAHDVDNLYVVDTSFFPSIGAVNPSLTAIANALRVGDHITERLR